MKKLAIALGLAVTLGTALIPNTSHAWWNGPYNGYYGGYPYDGYPYGGYPYGGYPYGGYPYGGYPYGGYPYGGYPYGGDYYPYYNNGPGGSWMPWNWW